MRLSYEEYNSLNQTIAENKVKLNNAFKLLRKHKIIARQNFACCGSCGSYEIATKMEEMLDVNKEVTGYVFYNRQSTEALRGDWRRAPDGRLYLSFADGSTNKYPNNKPISTVNVGCILVDALNKVGLAFEWDGTEASCVLVKMAETR